MPKKYVKSTTYSPVLDDSLYCIIDRSIVEEKDYGNELRLLQRLHAVTNNPLHIITTSLN